MPDLYPRGRASIVALQARAELNGLDATLLQYHAPSARWGVLVHGTGETIRVKAVNLVPAHNSWADPPADDSTVAGALLPVLGWAGATRLGATCKSWRTIVGRWEARLSKLWLHGDEARPERVVAAIRRCPLVTDLGLDASALDAAVVSVARELGPRLQRLRLRGCDKLTVVSVRAIASHCPRLSMLEMSRPRPQPARAHQPLYLRRSRSAALAPLSISPVVTRCGLLLELDVGGNCAVESVELIASSEMKHLRRLSVRGAGTLDAAADVADAPASVEEEAGSVERREEERERSLLRERFNLAVRALASSAGSPKLCYLDASETPMSDAGLKGLAEGCPALSCLDLSRCGQLSDASIPTLARMASLAICHLSANKWLSDEGVRPLLQLPGLLHLGVELCPALSAKLEGLTGAAQLNGCVGIVSGVGDDGKCGVHVLARNRDVKVQRARLADPTLSASIEHLCLALSASERTGSFDYGTYCEHFNLSVGGLMHGLDMHPSTSESANPPTLPQPGSVIDRRQYRSGRHHEGIPAGCNCTYFTLKYCAQAGTRRRIEMKFCSELPEAGERIERFLSGQSALAVLFVEIGLGGLSHPRLREMTERFPSDELCEELDAHAFTLVRCEGAFRLLHSCAGLFTWHEQLSASGWIDADEARYVLESSLRLGLERGFSHDPRITSQALMGYPLEPTQTYGQQFSQGQVDEDVGLVSAAVDPAAFLRAGGRLLAEMRRQGM